MLYINKTYIYIYICIYIYIYIYLYIYIYIIYISDAPDINMLTMFFLFVFWVVCILMNQIPAPQMNPDDFLQTVFP